MSFADRLRDLLGKKDEPAEDEPEVGPEVEDEDAEEDEDDVYPIW